MKEEKKLVKYMLISMIISIIAVITVTFAMGIAENFEELKIAFTHSESEIIEMHDAEWKNLANEEDMIESYQKNINEEMKHVPEGVKQKEAYLYAGRNTITMPCMQTLMYKDAIVKYSITSVMGLILGALIYFITNAKVKYSLLKLLAGFVIVLVITILLTGTIGKVLNEMSFTSYLTSFTSFSIIWILGLTAAGYMAIIGLNILVQKIKVKKMNKELNNSKKVQ